MGRGRFKIVCIAGTQERRIFLKSGWKYTKRSAVIASGWKDAGQFLSLCLPVFSIVYVYFFYGQKQHFFLEEWLG